MKTIETIKILEKLEKVVFNINDIAKIIRKPKGYSSLFLHRLKKKGLIVEIEKNKYSLKEFSPYVLFSNILYPSYLSFLTAYSYYHLTTQIPKKIYIASLKSKKQFGFENYVLKFIKFDKKRFFGYKKEKTSRGFVFIAEIEKAIVDSLLFLKYCPIDETLNAVQSADLDIDKLVDYSLKVGNKTVLKRVGYLLERKGVDIYPKIKRKINPKYEFLEPGRKGEKNKKWKLVIAKELNNA